MSENKEQQQGRIMAREDFNLLKFKMTKEPKKKECRDNDCDVLFFPSNSLQKFCSYKCTKKNQKPGKSSVLKPRKPIPQMSDKRKKENAIYLKKRIDFLNKPENKICPVTGESTTEIHHKRGRVGGLFLDESEWLAVSRKGHQRIEMNPEWAKEKGFSLNRL